MSSCEFLRSQYPKIFSGRCEISINEGWYDIVNMLCRQIEWHIRRVEDNISYIMAKNSEIIGSGEIVPLDAVPEAVEQVVATQVKEKFGGLRFYYNGGDDYIRGLVDFAENMSDKTCEVCGNRGTKTKGPWIKTLCEEHKSK